MELNALFLKYSILNMFFSGFDNPVGLAIKKKVIIYSI